MFGVGYLLWSQAFLMLSSHFLRLSMMDLSFIAPGLVVLPLQARLLALPPPTSITLLAIGPNNPFLAFFLSSCSVVLLDSFMLDQEICNFGVHNFHQLHCNIQACCVH